MNDDNHDVQEVHDGKLTDMRIEGIIDCIHREMWSAPDFDTLFNEIVREFVDPHVPPFKAVRAAQLEHEYGAVGYLMLMRLDFTVTNVGSANWPGRFDYKPDATCAVSIHYRHDPDATTQYSPGRTLTHAILCAIMQYARERSATIYNQGELRLN